MPRPKGSKNKKNVAVENTVSIEALNEQIAAMEAEIETLGAELKAKKAELKKLAKAKAAAEEAAAAAKAEEDKAKILEALAASGKSVDEILEMLK